jgi:hypothetical protein
VGFISAVLGAAIEERQVVGGFFIERKNENENDE